MPPAHTAQCWSPGLNLRSSDGFSHQDPLFIFDVIQWCTRNEKGGGLEQFLGDCLSELKRSAAGARYNRCSGARLDYILERSRSVSAPLRGSSLRQCGDRSECDPIRRPISRRQSLVWRRQISDVRARNGGGGSTVALGGPYSKRTEEPTVLCYQFTKNVQGTAPLILGNNQYWNEKQ